MLGNDSIQSAAKALASADALLITAGAGMGVDSGLPDFRGPEGFWNAYPPYRHLGLSFADMANPQWFKSDPEFAWGFYGHRLNLYRSTSPHPGFAILRRWSERMSCGARVFTSNVDGHFQRSGFDYVTEVHGSIHLLQCVDNCGIGIFQGDQTVDVDETSFRAKSIPCCPQCGGVARPNILMFGDGEWNPTETNLQYQELRQWLDAIHDKKLVVIELGAGTSIPTVRRFSESTADLHNALLIRINVREPQAPGQISLKMGALEALQAINASLPS